MTRGQFALTLCRAIGVTAADEQLRNNLKHDAADAARKAGCYSKGKTMTDEQKFMARTLVEAVRTCGEMLAVTDDADIGVIRTPSLSTTVSVVSGPLKGRRVRLTFAIVDDDEN